ncbi:carboxylate--amine ligase [Proteiniclasticum sp. SCR006]|uniref:Carboxylate--amine ligase n=1 Tax=Proteiniclasticum aestuarii TaxID=2817862 RepID=A0A939HAI6_9CLOT|nr:carboxylate--amine ligase [Proteiniclasticum aestuarii]MBO1264476.1 carboxylate--amine ligase [Proteiniclasticum aestuarii]
MKNKAVILGSNYYIGLSIIRCLGKEGIHTVAMDYARENTYGADSRYLKEQIIVPHYKKNEQQLLQFMVDYAKKEKEKPVLYPSGDPYVEFIDRNFDALKEGYLFPMDVKGKWTDIMMKDTLEKLAVQYGMPIPESVELNDPAIFEKVERSIGYPCILKPTESTMFVAKFRVKNFILNSREELTKYRGIIQESGLDGVIQRIIPGFDDHMYTYDAYLDRNSEVTHWMTCQKHRQFPINFGASVYTEQRLVPELHEMSREFYRNIGYKGFGEIEYKKDEKTGKYYLIEINTRTTNLNSLLEKAGVNFPLLAYKEMTGEKIEKDNRTYDTGIHFRYLYEDLLAIREYVRAGQLTKSQIMKSLFRRKAPAIWSFTDPKPAFGFLKMVYGKVRKRSARS